jgi:hypothetical protein
MFDQAAIDDAVKNVGYRRRKRLVYEAPWSNPEVEHFISFSLYGRPKEMLTAHFGLRNPCAEIFSTRCIRLYGGDLFRIFRPRWHLSTDCSMSFSFGRLIPAHHHWALNVSRLSRPALTETIESFVAHTLFPFIRDVTDLNRFFAFLMADAEPSPWVATNGAIRAAQIIAVGRQGDYVPDQIRTILEPFKRCILRGLTESSGKKPDADSYLDKVFGDWEATSQDIKPFVRRNRSAKRSGSTH